MQENETLQKVLAVLPTLQQSVSVLHEKECQRLNKSPIETQCIVDVSDPSIECARIDAGSVPVIRLSGAWVLSCMFNGQSANVVDAIRRGIIIAHKRLRWTLGKSKPRIAAEYVEKARGYRAAMGRDFSLPVSSFRTRVTVTMSDAMTGETETRENVKLSDVADVQRELAHLLTARVYAHEQVATLLDQLHGQEMAKNDPAPAVAVSLSVISTDYAIQRLTYEDYADGITHTGTVDIDELPEVIT
jgi:hypothetical protein